MVLPLLYLFLKDLQHENVEVSTPELPSMVLPKLRCMSVCLGQILWLIFQGTSIGLIILKFVRVINVSWVTNDFVFIFDPPPMTILLFPMFLCTKAQNNE